MNRGRWKVRALNPSELIPTKSLINVFITASKGWNVSEKYNEFKSIKNKSPHRVRYKTFPPVAKDTKMIKYHRPRFTNELPETVKMQVLRNRTKTESPVHSQAELLIEELIRNRQEIRIPSFEKSKEVHNVKERFFRSRGDVHGERRVRCDSLLQSIKESIRKQSYRVESELGYWERQPIRKWDSRSDRVLVQRKFRSLSKEMIEEEGCEEETRKRKEKIERIIEACGNEIANWQL